MLKNTKSLWIMFLKTKNRSKSGFNILFNLTITNQNQGLRLIWLQ